MFGCRGFGQAASPEATGPAGANRGKGNEMKNRAEWLTFGLFVVAVLAALGFLLRRGVHGQSAALAVALLVILLLRIGIFAWNLRRQRADLERR
jgi:hypothetical protein